MPSDRDRAALANEIEQFLDELVKCRADAPGVSFSTALPLDDAEWQTILAALKERQAREWRPIATAPRDGTHILARVKEPGDDDLGTPDVIQVREVWYAPKRGPFGEAMPWAAGPYGHSRTLGDTHYGEGLVLAWMLLPPPPRAEPDEDPHHG